VKKKISRNALCPCESGKKYKQCCVNKGFKWVKDEHGQIFKQVPMTKELRDILENQLIKFKDEFGREPEPDDLVFFDSPDEEELEEAESVAFGELVMKGFDPAYLYAHRKTGFFVTERNKNLLTDLELEEWFDAIDEFEELFENQTQWTPNKVEQLLANPLYAGIGPFPDGTLEEAIPKIIDDETWVRAQLKCIGEAGVRQHLVLVRRSLNSSLGMKVAAISHPNWLEESERFINSYGAEKFFRDFLSLLRPDNKQVDLIQNLVHLANISPELWKALSSDPDELSRLTPEMFEELICDRLSQMGFGVERVGKNTYHRDGGVDIVAWPKTPAFPFLMAVQAKHHRSPRKKTSVSPVRDLLGTVQSLPFHAGVLVTNTTFTPNAKWVAEQTPTLLRLRDIEDIRRWLVGDFLNEYDWREMPDTIEVCPGVTVRIPKP
jgi:hypothetical protein